MGAARDPTTGLTAQQEAFAQELARGSNQADAYRVAFPRSKAWEQKTIWEKASRLAATGKVKARVAALAALARREAEEQLRFDLPEALAQAEDAYRCARSLGQAGAMVAALALKAKLAGLLPAPAPVTNSVSMFGLTPQLAREIKAYIEALKAERAIQAEQRRLLEHEPGNGAAVPVPGDTESG